MIVDLQKQNKIKSGFTLIEMLVAISILSFAIIGLMTVLSSGISDTNYAKNKMIASYLAQEGIEYMRNMRDTYILDNATVTSAGWIAFLLKIADCKDTNPFGCKFDDQARTFEIDELNITSCIENVGQPGFLCNIYYNTFNGEYTYDSNANSFTGFSRKITYKEVGGPGSDEIEVISTVSWLKNSRRYDVTFSNNLLRWKQ